MNRVVQAQTRREQFLDAALALFAERGFEGTSMRDLSEATGSAPGLVYHYFRSKDELLFAVLEQRSFSPDLRRLVASSSDRPVDVVLLELATGFSRILSEREAILRIVTRQSQTDPRIAAVLTERIGEAAQTLAAYLEARIGAGELRAHDTVLVARTFFYAIVMMHITRTPTTGFFEGLVDTVVHGIGAAPDSASREPL